ncbi:MAG: hypothetical protein ABIG11_05730 [bacterium]
MNLSFFAKLLSPVRLLTRKLRLGCSPSPVRRSCLSAGCLEDTGGRERVGRGASAVFGLILTAVPASLYSQTHNPQKPVKLAWYTSLLPGTADLQSPAQKLAAAFNKLHPSILVEPVSAEDMFMRWREKSLMWKDADVVTDVGIELHPELIESGCLVRMEPPAQSYGDGGRTESGHILQSPPGEGGDGCSWAWAGSGYYAYTHAVRYSLILRDDVSRADAPDSLAALAGPCWKGKVVLLDPESSAEAACFYRFVARTPGLGFEWLKKMRRNQAVVVMFPYSLSIAMSNNGSIQARWDRSYLKLRAKGNAKFWQCPVREGSPLILYASAVSASSRHPSEAGLFVRWMLDPAIQRAITGKGAFQALAGADCARLDRESMACLRGWAGADPTEISALLKRASAALLGD